MKAALEQYNAANTNSRLPLQETDVTNLSTSAPSKFNPIGDSASKRANDYDVIKMKYPF